MRGEMKRLYRGPDAVSLSVRVIYNRHTPHLTLMEEGLSQKKTL